MKFHRAISLRCFDKIPDPSNARRVSFDGGTIFRQSVLACTDELSKSLLNCPKPFLGKV